jgi:hypothetical protein
MRSPWAPNKYGYTPVYPTMTVRADGTYRLKPVKPPHAVSSLGHGSKQISYTVSSYGKVRGFTSHSLIVRF